MVSWQAADDEFVGVVDHFSKLGVFDGAFELDGLPRTLVVVVAGRTASCPARELERPVRVTHFKFTLSVHPNLVFAFGGARDLDGELTKRRLVTVGEPSPPPPTATRRASLTSSGVELSPLGTFGTSGSAPLR